MKIHTIHSPSSMFHGSDFPTTLDEQVFNDWLEAGRNSKLSYTYMLIIWDELDSKYLPVYAEAREKIQTYERYPVASSNESLIAAYDLYSESKVG
ncbi:MAG: hypothetical protein RIF36_00610 [Imperialibacter sp.]|uniref:hypothetical protein n=1 Tax=Imperialibacter sp. TaxID=2038411 RepID=UPI0032EB25B4